MCLILATWLFGAFRKISSANARKNGLHALLIDALTFRVCCSPISTTRQTNPLQMVDKV